MKAISNCKKISYIFLLFIFLYNVPFTHIPLSGSKIIIIILAFMMISKQKPLYLESQWRQPIIYMLFLLVYSFVNVIFQQTGDYNLVYAEILFIVDHFFGSILFFNLLTRDLEYRKKEDVLDMIITVAFVQAIVIVLSFMFPFVNQVVGWIAYLPQRQKIYLDYGYARGFGLASSIVYDLSVIQAFSMMIIVYLLNKEISKKRKRGYYTKYVIIFTSVLLTGRTGLIGVAFSIFMFFYIRLKKTKLSIKQILNYFMSIALIIVGTIFFLTSSTPSVIAMREYVLEGFDSDERYSGFRTGTGEQIFSHYLGMFDELERKTWIYGDARFVSEDGRHYYRRNDLGIFRDINYFGLIGCFLLTLVYWTMLKKVLKSTNDKSYKLLMILSALLFLCAHFKGEFLLSCDMAINFMILVYLISVSNMSYGRGCKMIV